MLYSSWLYGPRLVPVVVAALLSVTASATASAVPSFPRSAQPVTPLAPALHLGSSPLPIAQRPPRRRSPLKLRVGVRPARYRIGGFARSEGCPVHGQIRTLSQSNLAQTETPRAPSTTASPSAAASSPSSPSRETTLLPQPTIFFYLPAMEATQVQFTLRAAGRRATDLRNVRFPISGEAGFVGVKLPSTVSLKAGESYIWELSIPCKANVLSVTEVVTLRGELQRLAASGLPSNPEEQAIFAAEQGSWLDALSAIAQLRLADPTDPISQADWTTLMTTAGLGGLVNAPVLKVVP